MLPSGLVCYGLNDQKEKTKNQIGVALEMRPTHDEEAGQKSEATLLRTPFW